MKKLVVMLLIASFASAFGGSIAYAGEIQTKTKSDSTMTKKMMKKGSMKSSKKMMDKKKKSSAKKDSTDSEPKEN